MMRYLGFLINTNKSELTPSQKFVFLGVTFDLVKGTVSPAPTSTGYIPNIADNNDGKNNSNSARSPQSFAQILPGVKATQRELQ